MSRRIIIAVALLWLGALALRADDSIEVQRPLSIMFMTDVGHASVLDSYLTPITYDGVDLRLSFDAMRACGNHNNWARQLNVAVQYDNVENNVGNNTMHNLAAQARWGMMRRWDDVTPAHLRFLVGPMAQLRGGAIYNPANSNNVVSIKGHASVGVTGMAVYNTHLAHRPLTLSYQLTMPVLGLFISPEYDESFYEIYLRDYRNITYVGGWGNRFDMENLLAADLRLGGTILRLGYRCCIERSWVSNINTHITTHSLVIGVGAELFTRRLSSSSSPACVSPLYHSDL